MKQFTLGLITILILATVGIFTFRGITKLMSRLIPTTSPTPSASVAPSSTPTPSATPAPSSKPATTYTPTTTKGGQVKGATTTKATTTTTTTTTSSTKITLVKTNACPANYVSEIRDITSPLTLKYSLKDGYATNIIVWKKNGEELLSKREIKGLGDLMQIKNTDYVKVEIQSTSCSSTSDNWLTITAER